jgi:hypothetical protein
VRDAYQVMLLPTMLRIKPARWPAQVKETIMTSALLRLPLSIPRKEKVQRVNDIIAQLVSHPNYLIPLPPAMPILVPSSSGSL